LHDADGCFVSVESLEIKPGAEKTLDFAEYVGGLTITNTRNNQRLYAENGKDILSGYVNPGVRIDVPPGRYNLRDATNDQVTVENVEIKAGQDTVLEFSK
jgi:molybdopterin-binding protein